MRGSDYHCVAVEGGHGIPKPPPPMLRCVKTSHWAGGGTGCNGPGTGKGGVSTLWSYGEVVKNIVDNR